MTDLATESVTVTDVYRHEYWQESDDCKTQMSNPMFNKTISISWIAKKEKDLQDRLSLFPRYLELLVGSDIFSKVQIGRKLS